MVKFTISVSNQKIQNMKEAGKYENLRRKSIQQEQKE